jgi:hypothetical protein
MSDFAMQAEVRTHITNSDLSALSYHQENLLLTPASQAILAIVKAGFQLY